MTIREWIRDREISGFPTFSVEEIRLALPHYSEQVIKMICSVYHHKV